MEFGLPYSTTTWTEIWLETVSIPENHVLCRGENQWLCRFFLKMYSHYQSWLLIIAVKFKSKLSFLCKIFCKRAKINSSRISVKNLSLTTPPSIDIIESGTDYVRPAVTVRLCCQISQTAKSSNENDKYVYLRLV